MQGPTAEDYIKVAMRKKAEKDPRWQGEDILAVTLGAPALLGATGGILYNTLTAPTEAEEEELRKMEELAALSRLRNQALQRAHERAQGGIEV